MATMFKNKDWSIANDKEKQQLLSTIESVQHIN